VRAALGEVYALLRRLEREVALKFLSAADWLTSRPAVSIREEALALSHLIIPYLYRLRDRRGSRPDLIAMDTWKAGRSAIWRVTVADYPSKCGRYAAQIAGALAHAHERACYTAT